MSNSIEFSVGQNAIPLLIVALAGCLLSTVSCQNEAEEALERAHQLRLEENYEKGLQVLDEKGDLCAEWDRAEAQLTDGLVSRLIEEGRYYEALEQLQDGEEPIVEPSERFDPGLHNRLIEALIEDGELELAERRIRYQRAWITPRTAKSHKHLGQLHEHVFRLVEKLVNNGALRKAEHVISEYSEGLERSAVLEQLQTQLNEAKYGKKGTAEYYYAKAEQLARDSSMDSLNDALSLLDDLKNEYPDHELAEEAVDLEAYTRERLSEFRSDKCAD